MAMAVAAAIALSVLGHRRRRFRASGQSRSVAGQGAVGEDNAAGGRPGAQLWLSRVAGGAMSLAVSPDGSTVYVTGFSQGGATDDDYATVADDAVTGAQLWAQRWSGHGSYADFAESVAVSPDGGTVFVTGFSQGGNSRTIAYTG